MQHVIGKSNNNMYINKSVIIRNSPKCECMYNSFISKLTLTVVFIVCTEQ